MCFHTAAATAAVVVSHENDSPSSRGHQVACTLSPVDCSGLAIYLILCGAAPLPTCNNNNNNKNNNSNKRVTLCKDRSFGFTSAQRRKRRQRAAVTFWLFSSRSCRAVHVRVDRGFRDSFIPAAGVRGGRGTASNDRAFCFF